MSKGTANTVQIYHRSEILTGKLIEIANHQYRIRAVLLYSQYSKKKKENDEKQSERDIWPVASLA